MNQGNDEIVNLIVRVSLAQFGNGFDSPVPDYCFVVGAEGFEIGKDDCMLSTKEGP